MKLADKRKAIEALLCAAGDANNVSLLDAIDGVGADYAGIRLVLDDSYRRFPVSKTIRVSDRDADAAYRLIESSPTLRREWFGAR